MELSDLLAAIRRRRLAAVVTFLLVVIVAAAIVVVPSKTYSASESLLVEPTPNSAGGGDVQVVQFLISALPSQVESQSFHDAVSRTLPPGLSRLPVMLTAKSDQTTGLLTVSVSSANPQAATSWGDAAGNLLVRSGAISTQGIATITRLNTARPSSSVNTKAVAAGAVVLGLLLSILVAVITDSVRSRPRRPERIRRRYGVPVFAEVPRARRMSGGICPHKVFERNHRRATDLVEGFEAIQLGLSIVMQQRSLSSVAVVSRRAREGKTTVAANLAWAWASTNRSVTLIDANLRDPQLGNLFEKRDGTTPSLAKPGSLQTLGQPTRMRALQLVEAGTADRHPAEIVTVNLGPILKGLADQHRLILVDTPAFGDAAEAAVVAAATAGVIIVADERRTNLREVGVLIGELGDAGASVVGIVLNRSRSRRRPAYARSRDPEVDGGPTTVARPVRRSKRVPPGQGEPRTEAAVQTGSEAGPSS